jgi:hypothetical protein
MSENRSQGGLRKGQIEDDQITVGWEVKPAVTGSFGPSPVTRRKSDVERAMTNMFRLAGEADDFEDCVNNFEKAVKVCREYGIQISPPPAPPHGGGPAAHQGRMDGSRIIITLILVLGVLSMVGWSISTQNAADAAQYVAPISGLAGIGLGWLFTNQMSPPSSTQEDDE